MKRVTLIALASLFTQGSFATLYTCKSEAMTHTDACGVSLDCPGNCKIYTWSRGYCGAGYGGCTPVTGGTKPVHVVERHCTGSYGCACERGDVVNVYDYDGYVDKCLQGDTVTDPDPTDPGNPGDPGTPSDPGTAPQDPTTTPVSGAS